MTKSFIFFVLIIVAANAELILLKSKILPEDYQLIWSDEFKSDYLDTEKWNYRYLGKRKLGYTTKESISVGDGTLKIIIYKDENRYCSGMISTQDKFEARYGYFEIKAKLPKVKGPQSAFWLQSSNFGRHIGNPEVSGMEIDIMEYVKTRPSKIHFSSHWDGYGQDAKKDIVSVDYANITDGGWHTFGLLWEPNVYKFFVDGKLMHTKKSPISHVDQYLVLSAEIGAWGGGIEAIAQEKLPAQFEIDYVRVYQKNERKYE